MLNKDFIDEVINKSIDIHGQHQCFNQTIEELGELIVEIAKDIRGFNNREKVIEEMTDVLICFEYLRKILCIENREVETVMNYKVERLNNRLK